MLVASLTFDNFVTEIWIRNLYLQLNLSSSRHEQVWDAYLHQSTRGAPGELSFVIQSSVSATMEQVQLTGYQGDSNQIWYDKNLLEEIIISQNYWSKYCLRADQKVEELTVEVA